MQIYKHKNMKVRLFKPISTLVNLLFIFFCIPLNNSTTPNWINHIHIISGHQNLISGPNLITTPSTNTYPITFTISGSTSNIQCAVGINIFELPQSSDTSFSLLKSLTSSNLQLTLTLYNETVLYLLGIDYIVMSTEYQYHLVSNEIICAKLNTGAGYRSENAYVVTAVGDNFYNNNSASITAYLVLQSFTINNWAGLFYTLSSTTNLIQNSNNSYTVNTTFVTSDNNIVNRIQYSILMYNMNHAYENMISIFQSGSYWLTSNLSNDVNLLTSSLVRYQSASRMFYGICGFNFSTRGDIIFKIDTITYLNVSTGIQFTNNIYSIQMVYYYFVQRDACPTPTDYFFKDLTNAANDNCASTCPLAAQYPNPANNRFCQPCHYSCLTCNPTTSSSACLTCDPTMHRFPSGAGPYSCPCTTGSFVDVGVVLCVDCIVAIPGCGTCTSSTTCSSCNLGYSSTGSGGCTCTTGVQLNGLCTSIPGCISLSKISTTQTCTQCNFTLNFVLNSSFSCACQKGTYLSANNLACVPRCGDKYLRKEEACDDGNIVDGDGCSSACTVESNFMCKVLYSYYSTCKINVTLSLTLLGIWRDTSKNSLLAYIQPNQQFTQFQLISNYTMIIGTTIPFSGANVTYDWDRNFLIATVDYSSTLQYTTQKMDLNLGLTDYFWYNSTTGNITTFGSNCQLTFQDNLWLNTIMVYANYTILGLAFAVFLASIHIERWIGLELIQTIQSVYFIMALAQQNIFQFSSFVEVYRFSNAYNDIFPDNFLRSYSLNHQLNALGIEKEFVINFNVMYVLLLLMIILLIVFGLIKRKYQAKLEQEISRETTAKLKKIEKIYSYTFSNIFIAFVFLCMYRVIFAFTIQMSDQVDHEHVFSDYFNVVAAILAFILIFGMISFLLYWYLMLPANFNQDMEFMSMRFKGMRFYYPICYLAYQAVFILILSIIYFQILAEIVIIVYQCLGLIFLIFFIKPYQSLKKVNSFIHNFGVVLNQLVGITATAFIIWSNSYIQSVVDTTTLIDTSMMFLILFLFLVIIAISIIRLISFYHEFQCKCCKKHVEESEMEELNYESMKKIVKEDQITKGDDTYRDKLNIQNKFENLDNNQKKRKNSEKKQTLIKRIELKDQEIVEYNENFKKFLSPEHIVWNTSNQAPEAPIRKRQIKKSSLNKAAVYKKSAIQEYLDIQMKVDKERKRQKQMNVINEDFEKY